MRKLTAGNPTRGNKVWLAGLASRSKGYYLLLFILSLLSDACSEIEQVFIY